MREHEDSASAFPDSAARSIIERRRLVVRDHLARWQEAPAAQTISLGPKHRDWLSQLERAVCRSSSPDFDERSRGRAQWLTEFLLPLAHDLDLVQASEEASLQQLYRHGSFDQLDPESGKLHRLPADDPIPIVRALLRDVPFNNRRVAALVAQQHCRDEETAKHVVEAWRRREQQAGGLARGVMLAYLTYGEIGLLTNSSYPHTDALLLLEAQRHLIPELSNPAVLLQLRADIGGLAYAWQTAVPGFWCLRLLQEPPDSEYRRRVAENFGTRRRNSVAQVFATQPGYTESTAQELVDQTLSGGLRALIAYRTRQENVTVTVERYERLQLQRTLDKSYGGLSVEYQEFIKGLAFNLQAAIRVSGVQFPLLPLLTERPSSARRVRVSRRFRFGLASIIKRRNQRRSRKQTVPRPALTRRPEPQPAPATQLIRTFAERGRLEESEAASHLRDLITYGAFGLLPRGQRLHCLNPLLMSWLRLIKYGRLDGCVPWPRLLAQLDVYRSALGLASPISPLLAQAVFNAIRRPSFWHGGQGEMTTRLRQRGTLAVGGAPRLHERWIVVSIASPVTLCDALGRPVGSNSRLVLVIEVNGLLPLAAWPTPGQPTLREVCLALYQAIWHPGAENWPVKGIPEQLVVDNELMVGDREDLDQAAAYLLSEVVAQPRLKLVTPELRALLRRFERGGIEEAVKHLALDERTPIGVIRALEQWINNQFFPHHRASPVWPEIRQHGVVMPGHDTPAVGWLLPRIDEATISRDGIEYEGRHYRRPSNTSLSEGSVYVRHFPVLSVSSQQLTRANGIFVESFNATGAGLLIEHVAERI